MSNIRLSGSGTVSVAVEELPPGLLLPAAQGGVARAAEDNGYGSSSSSNSGGGRAQQQRRRYHESETRQFHRRRRLRRAAHDREVRVMDARERRAVVHPEVYRHASRPLMGDVQSWLCALHPPGPACADAEGLSSLSLENLTLYTSEDIVSWVWPLLSSAAKNLTYAPFMPFPELPDVLNVRLPDTNQVARFMRLTGVEIIKRHTIFGIVFLRSLLVRTVVSLRTKTAPGALSPVNTYAGQAFCSNWESDFSDSAQIELSEMENGDKTIMLNSDANHVDSFDWAMALFSDSLHPRITLSVLSLLHQVVDRCGLNSPSGTLHTWGVRRLTRILLVQLDAAARQKLQVNLEKDSEWFVSIIGFLFKIALASKKLDILLFLFRCVYQHPNIANDIGLNDKIVPWVSCIETCVSSRKRLMFPTLWKKNYVVSLDRLRRLGICCESVVGICVANHDLELEGVFLTNRGIYKISLRPPYNLVAKNENAHVKDCCGVFIEGDCFAVQSKLADVVTFYDLRTLRLRGALEEHSSVTQEKYRVYCGTGKLIIPHFYNSSILPLYARYDASVRIKGVLKPDSFLIPPKICLLGIRFSLNVQFPQQNTLLQLIRLNVFGKKWISVRIEVNEMNSYLSIIFEHCGEIVTEVLEPIQEMWVTWDATLALVDDVARWVVRKNGEAIECSGTCGAMFVPSTSATAAVHFLEGTFSGFIYGFQMWYQSQPTTEVLSRAEGGFAETAVNGILCSFRMNEGSGCCFQSEDGKYVWRGSPPLWCLSQNSAHVKYAKASEIISYIILGDYYVLSNEHETAIVEDGFCTWIDEHGRIIEQQFLKVNPKELPFFCTFTGKMYSVFFDKSGLLSLRCAQTCALPAKQMWAFASMKNSDVICTKVLECIKQGHLLTPLLFSHYFLHHLNAELVVTPLRVVGKNSIAQLFLCEQISSQTISRLFDICEDLICNVILFSEQNSFLFLLLLVCGRLLTRQLDLLKLECPQRFISSVVHMYEKLYEQRCEPGTFLFEAKQVFLRLHSLFFVNCVEHEYQLRRIIETKRLEDVKDLFLPEHLNLLLRSAIEKNMKELLTSFLDRLKAECLMESEYVLCSNIKGDSESSWGNDNNVGVSFGASSATLETLLIIFSQKIYAHWHLVAISLLNFIFEGVLQMFDSFFFPVASTRNNLSILKQTSIGILVFPIVHFIVDLEIDSSVSVGILNLLNMMRVRLAAYIPVSPRESVSHCFAESYKVFASALEIRNAAFDLRYAQSIEVSYERLRTDDVPTIHVSLLTDKCERVVKKLDSQQLLFNHGGKLEIMSIPDEKSKGVGIIVKVMVRLQILSSHWIRDMSIALSHAILGMIRRFLLKDFNDTLFFSGKSIFRGGLSQEALAQHSKDSFFSLPDEAEESLLDFSDQVELLKLCEERGSLFSEWQVIYARRQLPHQERLEPILRFFCAAHVWHLHRPKKLSIQKALENSLEFMQKKSFFILEALQQGNNKDVMLDRALFLLKNVNPLSRLEHLNDADRQEAEEESRTYGSAYTLPCIKSVKCMPLCSCDCNRRRQNSMLLKDHTTDMSTFSASQCDVLGIIQRQRKLTLDSVALNSNVEDTFEGTSLQLLNFFLTGHNGLSIEQLACALVRKAQQSIIHTLAYRLQEEICAAHQFDEDLVFSVVCLHLLYGELVHLQSGCIAEGTDSLKRDKSSLGFAKNLQHEVIEHNYIRHMIGCGFYRELNLQKALCMFLNSVINQTFLDVCNEETLSKQQHSLRAVSLCAILCYPWNTVDISIICPGRIFSALKKCIFSAMDDKQNYLLAAIDTTASFSYASDKDDKDDKDYAWLCFVNECSIFSLSRRGVIIPNTMQASAEKVSIVEGDTVGIHVEDADVCCLARNRWKALRPKASIDYLSAECDCLASFFSNSIVTEMPDALYFEVTLELVLSKKFFVSIGVSNSYLFATVTAKKDNVFIFSSDGVVTYKDSSFQFSSEWVVGDVIGCGIMAPSSGVFFTRNGKFLGVATECSFTSFIPFVSVIATSTLVKLIVNFGENSPFRFDISLLHKTCRTNSISPVMISDSAFMTAHYLVVSCYRNLLQKEKSGELIDKEENLVSALLEEAAVFLCEVVLTLVRRLKNMQSEVDMGLLGGSRFFLNGNVLLARLFCTVSVVVDCFRFSAVTSTTHLEIMRLCTTTLIDADSSWVKVRAARCLRKTTRLLRPESLGEAVLALRRFIVPEAVVYSLVRLAHINMFQGAAPPVFVPLWRGGSRTVSGKGAFHGAASLPPQGTHTIGFRIRRRQGEACFDGAPLGGCYYVGLTHGHPQVTCASSLISRGDVYVLQDTDDDDQVQHLTRRYQRLFCAGQRQIYGSNEVVWLEFNADLGEATYYRDGKVPIGFAFENISPVDDLYPFVFLFNDDASCELIQAVAQIEDSSEPILNGLRRSVAVHTLQQLHAVPDFGGVVSNWIHHSVEQTPRNFDDSILALALLGSEKSYEYCFHETHGAVILEAVSNVALKAFVYLESDKNMRLFSTDFSSLRASFVKPPIFFASEAECLKCSNLLFSELRRNWYEALSIAPLIRCEEEKRREIEISFFRESSDVITLNFVSFLNLIQDAAETESHLCFLGEPVTTPFFQSTCTSFITKNDCQPASRTPVSIEQRYSTSSLYCPNPSIGVTTSSGYSVVRGNILLESIFSFAVKISGTPRKGSFFYVGVSAETELITMPQQVAQCMEIWALCSQYCAETTNVKFSCEYSMKFNADEILFDLGDLVIVQINRLEGTISFARVRCGTRVNIGVLLKKVSLKKKLRPFVFTGPDTVVVFSFLDCQTFPARGVFPVGAPALVDGTSSLVWCGVCKVEMSEVWYENEKSICLCTNCFNAWQFPNHVFRLVRRDALLPDYVVLKNSPKELVVGGVIEFVEDAVLAWSNEKSVNANIDGALCVAEMNSAFAIFEPIMMSTNWRVDLSLGHVAGVNGFSYGCIQPFGLLWQNKNKSVVSNYNIGSNLLLVTLTTVPHGSRVVVELKFVGRDKDTLLSGHDLFVGVTKLLCGCQTMSVSELEHHILNRNVWGTWCNFDETCASSLILYLLIDTTQASVLVSNSFLGLIASPVLVSCNGFAKDETTLRFCVYSHVCCDVFFVSGFFSSSGIFAEPGLLSLAIGFVSENFINPESEILGSSDLLFDTVEGTLATCGEKRWMFSPLVREENLGTLFSIGDSLTVTYKDSLLTVYRNGLLIATRKCVKDHDSNQLGRFIVYLSLRGMFAKIVSPLYGKAHLGKVVKTFGGEVGLVECMCPCPGRRRYAVRRNDVRLCAFSADLSTIKTGTHVAFKDGSIRCGWMKSAVVTSFENNVVTVRSDKDKGNLFSVPPQSLYILDNAGPNEVAHGFYSIPMLHASKVTHVFEVGKVKYGLEHTGFNNGIMFDICTHGAVALTGLYVKTNATGCNRVEVFFKTGSHNKYEQEDTLWTRVFSGFVDMHFNKQFLVCFSEIHVEANQLVALYINATHNSAIGYYSEEDGCSGNISTAMDTDGVLSVYFGRVSESSTPFLKTGPVPRGFCGSIVYTQNRDIWPLSVEKTTPLALGLTLRKEDGLYIGNVFGNIPSGCDAFKNNSNDNFNTMVIRSYPALTCIDTKAEFIIEVFGNAIMFQKLSFPVLISGIGISDSFGYASLCMSLFYTTVNDYAGGEKTYCEWTCVNRTLIPFQENIFVFYIDNLNLPLKKGTYIFNVVCWKSNERRSERLRCFFTIREEECVVKNDCYSVRGFVGTICATVTENVLLSASISTVCTGRHLNQNNSASYNGIMFEICSKKDILLEEIFCISQTTTNNVSVQVFWKEGSLDGAEKIPLQWRQIVSKELNLLDKQFFSPGQLNLRLQANRLYALYINTSSSCGVRFYNNSDGKMGDVGEVFEDDGVLTMFVGKKSESSLPFTEIPDEPRAFRGYVTYRVFMQQFSVGCNQAFFSAMQGLVFTRILVALTSYIGGGFFPATQVLDKGGVIGTLARISSLKLDFACETDVAGDLLNCTVKGVSTEEVRDGIVTLSFCNNDFLQFSTFGKGDLAIIADYDNNELTGRLVYLATDPDRNWHVLLREHNSKINNLFTISTDRLLPVVVCPNCNCPFASATICGLTGKVHLPFVDEKNELACILKRYMSQQIDLNFDLHSNKLPCWVLAESIFHDTCFEIQATVYDQNSPGCIARLIDKQTLEYIIFPGLFWGIKKNGETAPGFICPFLYHDVMEAYVSISFTLVSETWKVVFFSDLPFRLKLDDPLKSFSLSLGFFLSDGTRQNLLSLPVTYYAASGSTIHMHLPISASFLHFSCMPSDGNIHFFLSITEQKLPPVTPTLPTTIATCSCTGGSTALHPWLWSNNSELAELQPGNMCMFQGPFDLARWPQNKPRFWSFTANSASENKIYILELCIAIQPSVNMLSVDKDEGNVICRKISTTCDEVVGLAFTVDGDFIVYDGEDNILCHVPVCVGMPSCLLALQGESLIAVAVKNIGTQSVTLRLQKPITTRPYPRSTCFFDLFLEPGFYLPEWVLYDPLKVIISENGLSARCNGECGQAVIGLPLPMTRSSAFTVQINRLDRSPGDSLGSGHFAGIVASTFQQLTPHFEVLAKHADSVWLVQDVYDADSLPTQERIPPINASSNEVYLCGTQLHFIFNREDGVLYLSRDNEVPRVVFCNIPSYLQLSPFVRLDHVNAMTTLAPFIYNTWGSKGLFLEPNSASLASQPITPGFLFHFPYHIVFAAFDVFRHIVGLLPSRIVQAISDAWCSTAFVCTRFAYRLSEAVKSLVELGAFSRQLVHAHDNGETNREKILEFCSLEEVQRVIQRLSKLKDEAVAVFVVSNGNAFNDSVVFCLSDDYEIIGRVGDSESMIRLLHFNQRDAPCERTLHVVPLDNPSVVLNPCNLVTKNSFVMCQEEILQPCGNLFFRGVITNGWYDCTLDSIVSDTLDLSQQKAVAMSLISAIEHWHLHGYSHGHVKPNNVYIRIDENNIVTCVLWNINFLQRQDPCASPGLRLYGRRDMEGDKWSCAYIINTFSALLQTNHRFEDAVGQMMKTKQSISEIIDATGVLSRVLKKYTDEQTVCLQPRASVEVETDSCNGVIFDVFAKFVELELTKISFIPDATALAQVTLFAHDGSCSDVNIEESNWRLLLRQERELVKDVEVVLTEFEPIILSATGQRVALFIHTTHKDGVLLYSKIDDIKKDIVPRISEENAYIGITAEKCSKDDIPFINIQNNRRIFKGAITYVLSSQAFGCLRQGKMVASGDTEGQLQRKAFCPVLVADSKPGILLSEPEEEECSCLVFMEEGCEWVHRDAIRESNFNELFDFARLDTLLYKKLCERRRSEWEMHDRRSCCRQIMFHKRLLPTNVVYAQRAQPSMSPLWWWVSDPITFTGVISVWQVAAIADTSLFLTTSLSDVFSIHSSNRKNLLKHGQAFFCIDDWSRSVVEFGDDKQRVVRQLRSGILDEHLRLVFGPVRVDVDEAPVIAFLSTHNEDVKLLPAADGGCLLLLSSEAAVEENILLNSVLLRCSAGLGKQAAFSHATFSLGSAGDYVCVTQLNFFDMQGDIEWHKQKDEDLFVKAEASNVVTKRKRKITEKYQNNSCFFLDIQPRRNWKNAEIALHTDSQSLEVLGSSLVRQNRHGGPFTCTVSKPIFDGSNPHKVELFILSLRGRSVRLSLRNLSTGWSVDIPIPWFVRFGDNYVSPLADVQSVRLLLFVFPHLRRVLASVNAGPMYNVLPGSNCPFPFQLVISLSWPASFVQITRWQMLNETEASSTRDMLVTTLNHLDGVRCISPNVFLSVGVLARNSEVFAGVPPCVSTTGASLVSQIRVAMVTYARKLLGAVITTCKPQKFQNQLLDLISFSSLRDNLTALESFIFKDSKTFIFSLVAAATSYLSIPKVAQCIEKVEASVNVICVSLKGKEILPFFSTDYGPALMLLLLRTATVYSRSVRQRALSAVIKLLKIKTFMLPSHEALSVFLAPILSTINRLCKKGKVSSLLGQLGVLLMCGLIHRYNSERPTFTIPGINSVIPYAVVLCANIVIKALTSNPPLPLHAAFAQEGDEDVHRIGCELRTRVLPPNTFQSLQGVFFEEFCCSFGTKSFSVVLGATRKGNVVVGWETEDMEASGAVQRQTEDVSFETFNSLPAFGYYVDFTGKIFLCLGHKKESRQLKCRAKGGDVLVVRCFYHEQIVVVSLCRGLRTEISTRFENLSGERLTIPFFFLERSEDATFNGKNFIEGVEAININRIFDKIQKYPNSLDTAVAPQSYEFYVELALFLNSVVGQENFSFFMENKEACCVSSHDLAGFSFISRYLGVDVFGGSSQVPLNILFPYIARLRIIDMLALIFFKVVDFRQKTELFEIWGRLKLLCSSESLKKIQSETLKPFQDRAGQKASVIVHTMQAHPSVLLGPHQTLVRSVFGQLFHQLHKSPVSTFYASPMFLVKFAGFGSTDAGGPYRDVLSQLASEIMTTHPNGTFQLNPLFAPCGRGGQSAVMPNVKMMLSSQFPLMFEFFGKIIAACFMTRDLLSVELPPLFWKLLLSEEVTIRDLLAIDPDIRSRTTVEELIDRSADELEERFPGILENWATFCAENLSQTIYEANLPPSNLRVAQMLADNIVEMELHKYDAAISYIQCGFSKVVPLYTLNAFCWQQVELRICGRAKLSYDALRDACEINLSPKDAKMFLAVIASITDEDRMLFLRFITGQTRLPLKEPIRVQQSEARDSLPTSSTCFFTLWLPLYSSLEIMREKILYAIRQCKVIDTDGPARELIVFDN